MCYHENMNRNVLKIIAVISMLLDHVGRILLGNNLVFRILGRIAFPLFAFFIAEGWKYTRSRKKYVLWLSAFALISQVPYALIFKWYKFNIIFTFLYAILMIVLIELLKKETKMPSIVKNLLITISLVTLLGALILADVFGIVDYGLIGVLLILNFYFIKSKLKYLTGALLIALFAIRIVLFDGVLFENFIGLFALISIALLLFYNGKKGSLNLKYFFYVFYPAHLMVLWIISLII